MSFQQKLGFLLSLLFAACSVAAFDYGDPSASEQAHLESINRARLNPVQEAGRLGIDLNEGLKPETLSDTPVQALSFNAQLLDAARAHSVDMLKRNFFAHTNPDDQKPIDRMRSYDYDFQRIAENIGFKGTSSPLSAAQEAQFILDLHDLLFIDEGIGGRGHRLNILNPAYREIGVGEAFGVFTRNARDFNAAMLTTDFGVRQDAKPILLGVVYDDKNNDHFYTIGEGVGDVAVSVEPGGAFTDTASAGGYGLELAAETDYKVTFSHPGYGRVAKPLNLVDLNVKMDVLLSELSQCAVFKNNQLQVPCVSVEDTVFDAELSVEAAPTLSFRLDTAQASTQIAGEQCAIFQPQTQVVSFPCVTVGATQYRAELKFNGTIFELQSAAELQ